MSTNRKLTAFSAYRKYVALKLHFSSKKYSFIKTCGKTRCSEKSFNTRNDRNFFEALSSKYTEKEIEDILIANLSAGRSFWIGDLAFNQEVLANYTEWKKIIDSLYYTYDTDITYIKNYLEKKDYQFNDLFNAKLDLPIIYWLSEHKEISIETVCILNKILNFTTRIKMQNENLIWDDWKQRVVKYQEIIIVRYMDDLPKFIFLTKQKFLGN